MASCAVRLPCASQARTGGIACRSAKESRIYRINYTFNVNVAEHALDDLFYCLLSESCRKYETGICGDDERRILDRILHRQFRNVYHQECYR